MDNLTASNPRAHAIRVYYEGSSTIYEGMPVCYNYDTTTNWFGGSVSNGEITATTTTAEGAQNEGKYIRVENPANNNLSSFAGVVKKGGWCGKTGPRALDIYVPNGAIVPVRADVDTTVGVTVLAITVASQELGIPVAGTSRPVAIAAETETGLDSTAGITLATLDPSRFLYQTLDGTAFNVTTGTGNVVVNEISHTTAQTAGRFTSLFIQTALTGAGIDQTGYGSCLYCEQDISAAVGAQTPCVGFWTNITGGTQTEPIFGLEVGIYESGATLTSSNIISMLTLTSQFAENPAASSHAWIYLQDNGTYKPDVLLRANAKGDIGDAAMTGDHTFDTDDRAIAVYFQGSSETFYIPLMNNKGD